MQTLAHPSGGSIGRARTQRCHRRQRCRRRLRGHLGIIHSCGTRLCCGSGDPPGGWRCVAFRRRNAGDNCGDIPLLRGHSTLERPRRALFALLSPLRTGHGSAHRGSRPARGQGLLGMHGVSELSRGGFDLIGLLNRPPSGNRRGVLTEFFGPPSSLPAPICHCKRRIAK